MLSMRQLDRVKGKSDVFFLIVVKVKEKHSQVRTFKSNTILHFSCSMEKM